MQSVDKNDFVKEVKHASGKVLVDFWATWCGPCRAQAPILEELAAELPDLKIVKVNVDEEAELAAEYGVMSIPTLALFENGTLARQTVGLHSSDELKAFLSDRK